MKSFEHTLQRLHMQQRLLIYTLVNVCLHSAQDVFIFHPAKTSCLFQLTHPR